jgi:ActR/RegA family two-component response regulator
MRSCVLVVDDDPLIRIVSKRTLERAGVDVVTAGSVSEALDRVDAHGVPCQTGILDYFLGASECGCDLIAPLRARNPSIKIVVLSGLGVLAELVRHAHAAGADIVASKVNPDWLALARADPSDPGRARADVDLYALKRELIHGAFLVHRRNVSVTARALRIKRSTLQRVLRKMPPVTPGEKE